MSIDQLELCGLTIAEVSQSLRAKEYSPLELTQAYLGHIDKHNPSINAYITVTVERALEDAERATQEILSGQIKGPLHGIPIGIKDICETAGIRTTGGGKVHSEYYPTLDSGIARKLKEAGSILLGKLNTHEYAYGGTNDNAHYGPVRNPWDTTCIPGGSSGGSAAAVVSGMALATIGTDTAGSIRIPSALCGTVGLKPTFGRVTKTGVMPLSYCLDHVGPMTKTVEDAALMLGSIAGYDPQDPTTVEIPVDDYTASLRESIKGLRIGIPRESFYEDIEPETLAAVESAIEVFRDLGAIIEEIEITDVRKNNGSVGALVHWETKILHGDWLRDQAQDYSKFMQFVLSRDMPDATEVMKTMQRKHEYTVKVREALTKVDLLLTPTTPIVAKPIGKVPPLVERALGQNTTIFDLSGSPALSIPCGFTETGLPIGLQIVGRSFDERTVFRAGHAYEQATQWHKRHPLSITG